MNGDPLSDADHVVRHCTRTSLDDNGDVSSAAFLRKVKRGKLEEYLSVSWLEYFSALTEAEKIEEVKYEMIRRSRDVKASHKFAVLHNGRTINEIQQKSKKDLSLDILLSFKHMPGPRDDNSHSGIFNTPTDLHELMIAEYIVESIHSVYPAK